jgi:hypothetical protein
MAYIPPNPNGQATAANSSPVVLASDQSTIPVSNASLPLPTGAATAAKQPALGIAGAASADVITVQGIASGVAQPVSGTFWQATQPVSLATNTPTIAAGTALIGKVGIDQTTPGTTNGVQVNAALPAGTNAIGKLAANTGVTIGAVEIAATQTLATVTTVGTLTTITNGVKVATNTTGGATSFTLISAATTNATSVKGSAGTLYTLFAYNNGAGTAYLKLFNKATAPTVGTDTPVMTIMLPAGGGSNISIPPQGIAFGTGIAYSVTGTGTVADTTAVAATQVFVNGAYI